LKILLVFPFKEAYERALSVSTIKKGFRKCGIVPFDPEAIYKKRLIPNNNAAPNLPSTTSTDAADIDLLVNIDLTTTTDNVHCTTDDATMADPVKIEPQHQAPSSTLPGASSSSVASRLVSPLVSSGRIPASLLDAFIIPDTPEAKNTRVVTEARVLTSEDQLTLLREKLEAKKAEKDAKEERKRIREQKKLEKEKQQAEKEKRKEENK